MVTSSVGASKKKKKHSGFPEVLEKILNHLGDSLNLTTWQAANNCFAD